MPSETVMVLNTTLLAPAASAPAAASRSRASMCMLQGARRLDVKVVALAQCRGRRDANLRLREILVREAHGAQHRAPRRPRRAVDHDARAFPRIGPALRLTVLVRHEISSYPGILRDAIM